MSVHVHTEYQKAADNEVSFNAIFSSANEDRHGDIVEQEFDIRSYKKNPVFLDSHDYGSIEAIIGKVTKIGVKDGQLRGTIEFATENPRGALAAKLAAGGYLGATSIGFIPREFDEKGYIKKSELLEVSAVSVPANADAIFERGAPDLESMASETLEKDALRQEVEGELEAPQDDAESTDTITDTDIDIKTAQKPKISATAVAAKVAKDLVTVRRSQLKALTKAVSDLTEENRQAQRRKIHQAIRKMLDE